MSIGEYGITDYESLECLVNGRHIKRSSTLIILIIAYHGFSFVKKTCNQNVYIHSHCLLSLSHFFIHFQVVNDKCWHEGMGLVAPHAYQNKIIVESHNN
jgi:hypothetical protein